MTNEPVTVGIAFRLDEDLLAAIAAVDPRIRLVKLPLLPTPVNGTEGGDLGEFQEAVRACEVVLGPGWVPPGAFDRAERLRWYQTLTAGVDRLAADGLLDRGFQITTSSGLAAPAMAEWAIGQMVALAKGFPQSVRDQDQQRWQFRWTQTLAGKTLGIAGMGAIGRETAARARAFGMQIVATRRRLEAAMTDSQGDRLLPHSRLPDLLATSDFVLLAVPLTAETKAMIGATEFAMMKPTAYLLNLARGDVVDQAALIAALQAGTIAGAALDVTDPEPLPAGDPLWSAPNVIITPHISGAVEGYGHRAATLFSANLRRYLAGEPLANQVDAALGY
jgi:phosphoglycerate dehydrogenase-like enzyme